MRREAIGTIKIDGAYFGGYVKPNSWCENRRDRRLAKNQNGKGRVVIVIRERAGRTLPFVVKHGAQSVTVMEQKIRPSSVVNADDARYCYPLYHDLSDLKRINHNESYSDGEACTINAESFLSRICRAEIGMYNGCQFLLIGHAAFPSAFATVEWVLAACILERGWLRRLKTPRSFSRRSRGPEIVCCPAEE